MSTSYRPMNPVLTGHPIPTLITALSFDPVSDILWAGANNGVVTAIYTSRGYRGVFFPVGGNLAVSKISAGDNYVRALGLASDGLGSWAKGGMNKWFHRSPTAVTTFSDAVNSSHSLVLSTSGLEMNFLNSMTGNVVRKVPTSSVITHLQFSSSALISGSADGYLRLYDPRTGMTHSGGGEHKGVKAHQCSIQGLQTTGNYIFTIGHSERQSRPFPDPLVKVYDVRTMRALAPMPFSSSPAFIHVLPKRSSSIAVVSNQGLIHIMDATNLSAPNEFYQLNVTSYVTSMSISPTGTYMALGDADGTIHLMSQAEEGSNMPFNGFDGQPITWFDAPVAPPEFEWTDSTPLNSIGVPHFDSQLFSAWTPLLTSASANYPPPPKIPPQILSTMKVNDNVAYAGMPKELKGRRNAATAVARKSNSRFRSGHTSNNDSLDSPFHDAVEEVPTMYRKVEIEYSKFGVEDFDFGFYNKTSYSGLETHILNSYTNPVVQAMHYLSPIRRFAKSHITTSCPRENCLLCELGFVVRMLEDAKGTNCQTSNFCKVVGSLAQSANAIELIDYGREATDVDYAHKIQVFNRFLIDHLSNEGSSFPLNPVIVKREPLDSRQITPIPPPITQLMGLDGKNVVTCMSCKNTREKEGMTHIIDLMYPRKMNNEQPFAYEFPAILRNSVLRNISHKATCPVCKHLAIFTSKRYLSSRDLPPVLIVNANVYNEETWEFWQNNRTKTFLRPQVNLHGQIDGIDDPEIASYIIRAIVVQVKAKNKPSHLVAVVKVPEAEERDDLTSPWFLFNDFVVNNISEDEALGFPDKWKVPAIIYLERSNMVSTLDFGQLPDQLDPSILYQDTSIALHRDESLIKHEPLRPEELPTPGTVVAVDAEFVKMQQEESEFRSDGTTKVIRPARLSLARVSVLRGDGKQQGVPFIDDHIHTSEIIVDYLTEFSGINPGDLDPAITHMTLTPLKVAYKKLRLLVDRGCIFIGHGLSKDFRIINIYVPPEQVIDTVDLYFLKSRQRRLSLRFLSWFVLGEHIQQETHDSIEDARSALRLYNAFQAFEEQGIFDQKLDELYKEGRQYNFKPPTLPNQQTSPAPPEHASPPLPTQSAQYFTQPNHIFDSNFSQIYNPTHPMAGYPLHRPQTNRNWRR